MRESLKIVRQAMDKIPAEGPIKADAPGIVPPQREKMKTEMEALIYHFKIFTEGFCAAAGRGLSAHRIAARRTGLLHCQRWFAEALSREFPLAVVRESAGAAETGEGRLIADVIACIGTIDIVLG